MKKRTFQSRLIILPLIVMLSACANPPQTTSGKSINTIPAGMDSIYTAVQKATFQYFWEGAEPNSGLARERFHVDGVYPQNDKMVVTSGGSGFGVMAILIGMERGWITREQGLERIERILNFLEKADTYHGVWPHWWNGETGKTKPFSRYDDGGDLVETSFMLQGLLCVRQYLQNGTASEKALARRADDLWRAVDFDFYRNGQNALYWHWSPNHAWRMNLPIRGYDECLIVYVLAASSPTHAVPAEVYYEGWARNGAINGSTTKYGYTLKLKHNGAEEYGGPMFWAHYSYLGLDPRGLKDQYADYWQENQNQALINYNWCVENKLGYKGYGPVSWGLTSSYSVKGYAGHAPGEKRDLGVISPTAALASMPYTPKESMAAMHHWYTNKKDSLWGPYGFYDAFSETSNWHPKKYLAIDQGPIVVMMENHKTGFIWDLFMSSPEIKTGLKKLGFESPHLK